VGQEFLFLFLCTLAGVDAYMLAAPMHVDARVSGMVMSSRAEFCYGRGMTGMKATAIGFQGIGGTGTGMGEEVPKVEYTAQQALAPAGESTAQAVVVNANEFRFGSGQSVIGFQGGTGKGMGIGEEVKQKVAISSLDAASAFRFGSGRTVVGFLGGTGKGVLEDVMMMKKALVPAEAVPAVEAAAEEAADEAAEEAEEEAQAEEPAMA